MASPFAEELQKRQNPFRAEMQRRGQLPAIVPNGAARPLPADMFSQQLIPGVPQTRMSTVGASGDATGALLRAFGGRIGEAAAATPNVLANVVRRIPAQLGVVPPESAVSLTHPTIQTPSDRQIIAGIETASEVPGSILSDQPLDIGGRFQANLLQGEQIAEEHPVATFFGNALGDAATVAAGRAPFARTRALQFLREGARPEIFFGKAANSIKPTTLRLLNRFVQTPAMTKLASGAGRSLEAGFEGAALAGLHEGDPLQTAAYAAGGQAAGSLLISSTSLRNPKTLPYRALALFSGIQLTKSFVPGGRDRSLESIEESFDTIKWMMVLGAAARVAGAGRRGEQILDKSLPRFAEALNSMHRGTFISMIEQAANDGTGTVESVLQKLVTNPDAFSAAQRNRLERSIGNGTLSSEIDKLMEVPSFREALDGE